MRSVMSSVAGEAAISIGTASLTSPGALAVTRYWPGSSSAKTNLPSLSERAPSGVAARPVTITSALATARPSGSVILPLRLAALAEREIKNNEQRIKKERTVRGRGPGVAVMVASRASRAPEMDWPLDRRFPDSRSIPHTVAGPCGRHTHFPPCPGRLNLGSYHGRPTVVRRTFYRRSATVLQ